jgi:hypothetical protein
MLTHIQYTFVVLKAHKIFINKILYVYFFFFLLCAWYARRPTTGKQGFSSVKHLIEMRSMHTRRGHQILLKRIIASWLNVDILLVACFFVPEYCTDKKGDRMIEVFLDIAIFTLSSCFRRIFERFREVLVEHLEPGGTISVAQDVLEFQERLRPAPVKTSSRLVKLKLGPF